MKDKQKKTDDLLMLIIPIGLCLAAAMWYLFGFGFALLSALIYFPLACFKILFKK